MDIREWPTPKEAAIALGKTPATIKRMAADGRLLAVIAGGGPKRQRLRIDPASIAEWIGKNCPPLGPLPASRA